MRTDCFVEHVEVVAIVLDEVASAITAHCDEVKKCVEAEKIGWIRQVTKDFLSPTANTTKIVRGPNSRKRKCCAIKLSALPTNVQLKLKDGQPSMLHVSLACTVLNTSTYSNTSGVRRTSTCTYRPTGFVSTFLCCFANGVSIKYSPYS